MRLEACVVFDEQDHQAFRRVQHLTRYFEEPVFEEKDKGQVPKHERVWNSLCAKHSPEPWTPDRITDARTVVRELRAAIERQALDEGWPIPSTDMECHIRDALVAARKAQLVEVDVVCAYIEQIAHRIADVNGALSLLAEPDPTPGPA